MVAGRSGRASIHAFRGIAVVDDAGPHPGDRLYGKRRESNGAVAKHGIQSTGMAGAEIPSPHRGSVVGVGDAPVDNQALILIRQGWKMPADDTFVPARIVPAFVVAAVGAEHLPGQALFGGHDAV